MATKADTTNSSTSTPAAPPATATDGGTWYRPTVQALAHAIDPRAPRDERGILAPSTWSKRDRVPAHEAKLLTFLETVANDLDGRP